MAYLNPSVNRYNAWNRSEPGTQHEYALDVAVDGASSIYVAHEHFAFDNGSGDTGTYSNIVTKYSKSGSLQWQRILTIGTPYGITVSSSGSVYVVGTKGLAHYSNNGSLIWSKTADNSRGNLKNAGDIVISGSNLYTRSVKTVRKYDGSGKQLWIRTQSGLSNIVLQDMDGDGGGNVYLSGKYQASTGNMDAFVRKLDSSGRVLWTKTYGTSKYDDARGIATTKLPQLLVQS